MRVPLCCRASPVHPLVRPLRYAVVDVEQTAEGARTWGRRSRRLETVEKLLTAPADRTPAPLGVGATRGVSLPLAMVGAAQAGRGTPVAGRRTRCRTDRAAPRSRTRAPADGR